MSNPRIEEVDDDEPIGDPEEMDLDEFDFARPQGNLQSAAAQAPPAMSAEALQAMMSAQNHGQAHSGAPQMPQMPQMSAKDRERLQREAQERSKNYQCIYPVYFDSTRSREEGRRVGKHDAVPNPLAREIVDAVADIQNSTGVNLQIVFEPSKTHPKDWANPGRVRVLLKKEGRPVTSKIQSKHHLFKLISDYLKSHPTTEQTPMNMPIPGMPMPKDNKIIPPAIPRGFKIGTILPLHSPALSGGGVSENMFSDMMAQMGGQLPGGMGSDVARQPQKKVKDKKKK